MSKEIHLITFAVMIDMIFYFIGYYFSYNYLYFIYFIFLIF